MSHLLTFCQPSSYQTGMMMRPFAVLLDVADSEWADDDLLRRFSTDLLETGCEWFLCFGQKSEEIHDRIDDFVVELARIGITTTYHVDESEEEVLHFLINAVLVEMKEALVLVRDERRWRTALALPEV